VGWSLFASLNHCISYFDDIQVAVAAGQADMGKFIQGLIKDQQILGRIPNVTAFSEKQKVPDFDRSSVPSTLIPDYVGQG